MNGKGKTTVLSHFVDAFHENGHFSNADKLTSRHRLKRQRSVKILVIFQSAASVNERIGYARISTEDQNLTLQHLKAKLNASNARL